jgi:hypothetical protein
LKLLGLALDFYILTGVIMVVAALAMPFEAEEVVIEGRSTGSSTNMVEAVLMVLARVAVVGLGEGNDGGSTFRY